MPFLRPDGDLAAGLWTTEAGGTTNLFASIDESTLSDADYIQSGVNPSNDTVRFSLSNPGGAMAAPETVSFRYKKSLNSGTVGLKVRLLQGTTEIASWTYSNISATYTDTTETLTGPQIAAITDATDLRLEFIANPPAGLWTPALLDGTSEEPYHWGDANGGTFLTLSGSDVTLVTDRSGNRNLSTDITGAVQAYPTYASNMVSCAPSTFQAFHVWSSAFPSAYFDLFFIGDPDNTATQRTLLAQSTGGDPNLYIKGSGDWTEWDGGAERAPSPAVNWGGTGKRLGLIRWPANNSVQVAMDGADVASAFVSPGGSLNTTPFFMNGRQAGSGFGGMHEWLFMPPNTSDATKRKVEGYLAWRWDGILGGTTFVTALPSGHAYKSAAPTP